MVDCAGSQRALVCEDIVADDESFEPGESRGSAMRTAGVSAAALATAACGGGGSGGSGSPTGGGGGGGTPAPTVIKPETDAEAARFLLRSALSASATAIADIRERGYEPWLDREIARAPAATAESFFAQQNFNRIDSERLFFSTSSARAMIWKELLSGGDPVRKRIALALSEFFVVSLDGVENLIWRSQAMGSYWDTLMEHAFGSYRKLLEAMTLTPAMGAFLNTLGNRKADASTGRVPDENYGREVMQLFSIGLYELNIDGSTKLDGAGNPVETYDNDDVAEIAKVFTGYDLDFSQTTMHPNPSGASWEIPEPDVATRPMTADPSKWRRPQAEGYHSAEAKSFLGTTIPAGTGASETLKQALDTLANHPNVGPFFGKQMIQRLVTSNPSPAYVERVASVFNDDGSGKRGNLAAVFKAVLLDEEALSDAGLSNAGFGKLREPMLRYIQWARTAAVESDSGDWDIGDLGNPTSALGQSPLNSPSVFNFFRPGYTATNSQAAANNMVAPEFQLVNETTVAGYINFMYQAVRGEGYRSRDVKPRYTAELGIAHDSSALLDRLDLLLTANQLTSATRQAILDALNSLTVTQTSPDADKLQRIHIAVLLVLASYDYLIQR